MTAHGVPPSNLGVKISSLQAATDSKRLQTLSMMNVLGSPRLHN
jgi:hypothetical protein